jgi:hypothetical protein
MTADLLEHSLQPSPSNLIPYQTAAQPMKMSQEMQNFYNSIPVGSYPNWTSPQNVELRSNRDLFFAFQDVRVSYKGCKSQGGGNIDFRVTDTYTFRWQAIEFNDLMHLLGTIGANAAYIDQLGGVIHPYNIEVDFTIP